MARQLKQFIAATRTVYQQWERLRGESDGGTSGPQGERTPEKDFWLPILRALVALGGQARASEVLELVYAEMKPYLKPADLRPLRSNPRVIRWQNAAHWARLQLVHEGLLRKDTPRGV
ncbi:MAG: winged helix-turn-helix domain-containing protein [Chlorobiota bacterium]